MNAATWSEPNKLPAGILTLAVHALLFALLYFGISWRNDPPQGMTVDIWSDLPATQAPATTKPAPPPPPKPAPEPPKPAPSVKADISLGEKKPPKAPAPPKPAEPAPKTEAPPSAAQTAQQQALQAQTAATGKIVDDYTGRIRAKIRGYVFVPDNVADDAQVQFDVTLLPGGSVLNVRKTKSSGNAAYDDAVERAILRAQPLPLPEDPALFSRFRQLHLTFRPKE